MSINETEYQKGEAAIFAALPDDPFGDSDAREPASTSGDQDPNAGAEAIEEAAEALLESEDEGVEEQEDADESDEYEEADDEDEDGDEAEDEADEGEAEDGEEPDTIVVKVDGEEVEVTLEELRQGYSRTASWTQKSQRLAEERKALEAEAAAVKQVGAEYAERLQNLETQMRANLPEEPSPQNPQAWINWQQEQHKLQAVAQERFALQQKMEADRLEARQRLVEEANETLRSDFPEWKDPVVESAAKKSLATFAVGVLGFEQSDVEGIVDARVVRLIKAAKELHDLNEAKTQVGSKKAKAKKTLKPGSPSRRSASSKKAAKRKTASRDNLKKTGHIKDGEAAIHDLLGDDF